MQSYDENKLICPYMLAPYQAEYLDQFGVPHLRSASRTHGHAEFKGAENYFLYLDLPPRLSGDCLFVSIKQFKWENVLTKTKAGVRGSYPSFDFSKAPRLNSSYLSNPIITPADRSRYIRGIPLPPPSVFAPTQIVLADSAHYLSPGELANLWELYPTLSDVYAVVCIPPEIEYLADSLYPKNYTISYFDDAGNCYDGTKQQDRKLCTKFAFRFTQNSSTFYEQPLACLSFLKMNAIHYGSEIIGVERLHSIGPQHLLCFTRGLKNPKSVDFFHCPSVIKLPPLCPGEAPLNQPFIPLKVYRQVLFHAESLNNYQPVDTTAKVRTHIAQDEWAIPTQSAHQLIRLVRWFHSSYHPSQVDIQPRWYTHLYEWIHSALKRFLYYIGCPSVYRFLYRDRLLRDRLVEIAEQPRFTISFPLKPCHVTVQPCKYFHLGSNVNYHPKPPPKVNDDDDQSSISPSDSASNAPSNNNNDNNNNNNNNNNPPPGGPSGPAGPPNDPPPPAASQPIPSSSKVKDWQKFKPRTQFEDDLSEMRQELRAAQKIADAARAFDAVAFEKAHRPKFVPVDPQDAEVIQSMVDAPLPPARPLPKTPLDKGKSKAVEKPGRSLPSFPKPKSECDSLAHAKCLDIDCQQHNIQNSSDNIILCKAGHPFSSSSNRNTCHLCSGKKTKLHVRTVHDLAGEANFVARVQFDPSHLRNAELTSVHNHPTRQLGRYLGPPIQSRAPTAPKPNTNFLPRLQYYTIDEMRAQDINDDGSPSMAIEDHSLGVDRIGSDHYPPHDCLLRALSSSFSISPVDLWSTLCRVAPAESLRGAYLGSGLTTHHAHLLGLVYNRRIIMRYPLGGAGFYPVLGKLRNFKDVVALQWTPGPEAGHFTSINIEDVGGAVGYEYSQAKHNSSTYCSGASSEFLKPVLHSFRQIPDIEFKKWTPCRKRAKVFYQCWREQQVGVQFHVATEMMGKMPHEITNYLDQCDVLDVQVAVLEGLWGSGKSAPAINILQRHTSRLLPPDFLFGFPRVFLRDDTKSKFKLQKYQNQCFRTWEHALANQAALALFDEFCLFPPGYFDFFWLLQVNRRNRYMILLGDRNQGTWQPEPENVRRASSILTLPQNVNIFKGYASTYRLYTYRLPQEVAHRLGVHSLSKEPGSIEFYRFLPPSRRGYTILVPAIENKTSLVGQGYKAFTYTEVQGAEFDTVYVLLTTATLLVVSPEALLVAVTRAKKRLVFVSQLTPAQDLQIPNHPILGPLVGMAPPASPINLFGGRLDDVTLTLPSTLTHVAGAGVSASEALCRWSNDRLDNLPASFRANAPIIMEYYTSDPCPTDSPVHDELVRTHLPSGIDPHNMLEAELPLPRESLEMNYAGLMSAQFIESNKKGQFPSVANIFPKQTSSTDPTLMMSAVDTRFIFAKPDANDQEFAEKRWLGPLLFERFRSYLGLSETGYEFDPELFVMSIIETLAVKLDKPIATIWNNIDRSEPEWLPNYMHAFVKSQSKAKAETCVNKFRLSEEDSTDGGKLAAKAGQPLVTSADFNVLKFGPWTRYMRSILYREMRSNVYIHGGKTLVQLDEFSKKFSQPGDASTCDFTAYDQSCRAETLSFELCLFDFFSLSSEFPDAVFLYFFIKTHMFTQFGPSAIMRFTGEFGTYDFNTWYNIAYMSFRFLLDERSPDEASAFSGDDSIFFFVLKERPDWTKWSRHFALVGKLFIGPSKDFCGWWLLPCGAVRNPILLALKIAFREARNDLADCLDSYFLEALFAYNHGDSLTDHLDPLALEAQSWVIRFCHTHSHMVPHLSLIQQDFSRVNLQLTNAPARIIKSLMPRLSSLQFFPYKG